MSNAVKRLAMCEGCGAVLSTRQRVTCSRECGYKLRGAKLMLHASKRGPLTRDCLPWSARCDHPGAAVVVDASALRAAIVRSGISSREAVRRFGVSTIGNLIRAANITMDSVHRICGVLGVGPDRLFLVRPRKTKPCVREGCDRPRMSRRNHCVEHRHQGPRVAMDGNEVEPVAFPSGETLTHYDGESERHAPMRRTWCRRMDGCVDKAEALQWPGFSCSSCPVREESSPEEMQPQRSNWIPVESVHASFPRFSRDELARISAISPDPGVGNRYQRQLWATKRNGS